MKKIDINCVFFVRIKYFSDWNTTFNPV